MNQVNFTPGSAIYRGWMMTPKQYQSFYSQLRDKYQIELLTSPKQYEQYHLFPNIYPELIEDTSKMLTFPLGTKVDIEKIRSQMSAFMIKDYVKSAKGTELPSRISSAISQQKLDEYLEIFYRYRGDLLTGGICIKEYVELKTFNGRHNEYRVFYANGKAISIAESVANDEFTTQPPRELVEKYQHLPSPFYTVGYAVLADGSWIVIEAGDGQVSGLSDHQDRVAFMASLCN